MLRLNGIQTNWKTRSYSALITLVLLATAIVFTSTFCQHAFGQDIKVPEGFKITKVAGNDLASNIYSLTVDSNGAVVVAGPGYVRRLVDVNSDGVFDRAQQISDLPRNGAMGLYFDGDTLYAVGDQGVLRMNDPDGDGVLGNPEIMLRVKTGGEHDAHAIRKGPDGQWYLLCGNRVGPNSIKPTHVTFVEKPHAGFLLKMSPDFSERRIVNHGFRNPYDFDFNSDGVPFTFDSDGERDISLPWYQPCRVYRLSPGDDAGWMSASHKLDDAHPNMPEVIGRLGRGSPTGVVCYRHFHFPNEFYDAIFVLDWTNGKIVVHKRDPATGQYAAGELFAQPEGVSGFAVTDAEVGIDGSLYVSTGGRGTEGAVYRIQAEQSALSDKAPSDRFRDLNPQPNSSWARKRRLEQPTGNDWQATIAIANEGSETIEFQLQQIDLTQENLGAIPKSQFDTLKSGTNRRIADRLQLALPPEQMKKQVRVPAIVPNWKSTQWPAVFDGYFVPEPQPEMELDLDKLLSDFESDSTLNPSDFRRISRTLAVYGKGSQRAQDRILTQITPESSPVDDIHGLLVLTRMSQSVTVNQKAQLVNALLSLPQKLNRRNLKTDRNWPIRMRELAKAMVREFQVEDLLLQNRNLVSPGNLYLLEILNGEQKRIARSTLADLVSKDKSFVSSASLQFLAEDPTRFVNILREYKNEPRFLDPVVKALAAEPIPADRDCLLRGFATANRTTWRLAANGLRKIPAPNTRERMVSDSLTVLKCGLRLSADSSETRIRESILRLLGNWHRGTDNKTIEDWRSYLAQSFPVEFEAQIGIAGDSAADLERLAKLDFSTGRVANGKVVYEQLLCAKCHDGGNRLGPSLNGLSKRFTDTDILSAILNPDQQVPQRYRALKILTEDGRLHFGAVIYESADGTVMADRNANTIRIESQDIQQRVMSDTSLMPSGLLDNATDQQVSDLMAFLKSLAAE